MYKLRKLEEKDIPLMQEWMRDDETLNIFQKDFSKLTVKDLKIFVNNSFGELNKHFAIVNDEDEYLGTVSLKNIDKLNSNAEYAISSRKVSRGTGSNFEATKLILEYAFHELKLNKVYLNVLAKNIRAKRFYKKCGFVYEGLFRKHLFINGEYCDLEWYSILCER